MDTQAAHMQLRKKTETEIGFPLLFLLRDKVQKSLKVEFILELIAGLSEWHFGSKLLKSDFCTLLFDVNTVAQVQHRKSQLSKIFPTTTYRHKCKEYR